MLKWVGRGWQFLLQSSNFNWHSFMGLTFDTLLYLGFLWFDELFNVFVQFFHTFILLFFVSLSFHLNLFKISVISIANVISIMVFRLDGCSFHYARKWSISGISICLRHLVTSKESSIRFFSRKKTFLLHTRATCSQLPSYISTIIYIVLSIPFFWSSFLAR